MKTTGKKRTSGLVTSERIMKGILLAVLLLFPFYHGQGNQTWSEDGSYAAMSKDLIRSNIEECKDQIVWMEGIELSAAPLIYSFYHKNNYNPAWTNGNDLTPQSQMIFDLLHESYKYGIEPVLLNIEELEYLRQNLTKENQMKQSVRLRAGFEFLITNSVMTFMLYISRGNEFALRRDIFVKENQRLTSLAEYLHTITTSDDIRNRILSLQPESQDYRIYQEEMEQIVNFIELLEKDNTLEETDQDVVMYNELYNYLLANKENLKSDSFSGTDDPSLLLVEIQKKLELRETGKLNAPTRNAITMHMRSRYAEIAYHMERMRNQNTGSMFLTGI
jgi:murein L,D-transpeptidase YcbB/YkuD